MSANFANTVLQRGVAAVAALGLAAQPAVAASCTLPPTEFRGEQAQAQYQALSGFVLEQTAGLAQDLYAQSVIRRFTTASEEALTTLEAISLKVDAETVDLANKWTHVLKVATLTRAVAQGELEPIRDWAVDEAVGAAAGSFAAAMGVTSSGLLVGAAITALKTVKESYEALENEDCLTNIDLGYYAFLEDEGLRDPETGHTPPGAVDYYIRNYLAGAGRGQNATDRATNRRILQCYVNQELPESERVIVSQEDAEPGLFDRLISPFTIAADTIGSTVDLETPRIRTPVAVMLTDFNARATIEEQSRQLNRMMQTGEYADLEALANAMQATALTAEWLCDRLAGDGPHPDMPGRWAGQLVLAQPSYEGEPVMPPMPMTLTIAETGTVEGELEFNGVRFDLTAPAAQSEEMEIGVLIQDPENSALTILDLDLDGAYRAGLGTLEGQAEGVAFDLVCMMQGLFADEDEPAPVCAMVDAAGTWTLQRQAAE